MRQMWKKRRHGSSDSTGQAQAEEGRTPSVDGGDRIVREEYVIALLERITYQLYHGPMEFEDYLEKVVRKNAPGSASPISSHD